MFSPPLILTNQGPDGANLFVFHIPNWCSNRQLYDLFTPHGSVISCRIFVDKISGRSRGFGFVSYNEQTSAQAAIDGMNGYELGHKRLKVEIKRSKRGGGSGSGGSGGGGGGGGRRNHNNRNQDRHQDRHYLQPVSATSDGTVSLVDPDQEQAAQEQQQGGGNSDDTTTTTTTTAGSSTSSGPSTAATNSTTTINSSTSSIPDKIWTSCQASD